MRINNTLREVVDSLYLKILCAFNTSVTNFYASFILQG
jgi:hypothetical protein